MLHWIAILVFSIFIYIIFLFLSYSVPSFRTYRTSLVVFGSWFFYLTVLFFCACVYIWDTFFMILNKEIFTPLITLFTSIIRRDKDTDENLFRKASAKYHKNAGLEGSAGGSKDMSKPLMDGSD